MADEELEKCDEAYEIERWQLRVKSYLDEAFGDEIANKFQNLNINDNLWDGSARQRGCKISLLQLQLRDEKAKLKQAEADLVQARELVEIESTMLNGSAMRSKARFNHMA